MTAVPSAQTSLTPGQQITKAVSLVSPLSSGGMGAVWIADHQGLKTRVVVKFMLDDLNASSSARTRFSREAAAAAHVKSPHVVQMLDHGVTDDGVPFIVMEHLEGHDLGDELEQHGALEPGKALAIVTQIGKALSKVHAAGLLHRDIKPDNIFLVDGEEEVFVKLLDFGIAKTATTETGDTATLDSETKTGQIVGTPYYMSPEQVTAQKVIDLRSDLWALGVVAFEALTGQRPFDGPSFGALAVKIATGTPLKPSAANPALPIAVDAWFAKACAREAVDRFGSAKELADGLRAALDGVVPSAAPISNDSGTRTSPTASAISLAKTENASLARSEAGVSVTTAKPQRSSLYLLGGLVVAAVLGIVMIFTTKIAIVPPVNGGSAPSGTTAPPGPSIVPAPEPKLSAMPVVDAGAPTVTATHPPIVPKLVVPPPASAAKPIESAKPKPSAEPDPLF